MSPAIPSIRPMQQGLKRRHGSPATTSFEAMLLGWAVMLTLLTGGLGLVQILDGTWDVEMVIVMVIFAIASAVVCFFAWVLVALPVTFFYWKRMVNGVEPWWMHALRGTGGGCLVGLLPMLGGQVDWAMALFGSLALVVGGVAGTAIGWWVRKERLISGQPVGGREP